jgi:arylsulfatase A-like enzyme
VPDAAAGKGASTRRNLKAVMEENDRQIGRLRAGLKALGIERETLLVFASDNGPLPTLKGARSGGLRGSKLSLYEGGIRVPFLAVWPGMIPAGATDDATVFGAVDVFPTVCKLAGAVLPRDMEPDGEDRSAALLGRPQPGRARPLLWEYGRNDTSFAYPTVRNGARPGDRSPNLAVRDGRWKLLVNADGTGAELYDLSTDRAEAVNLAASHPDQTATLKKLVLDWRKSLPCPDLPSRRSPFSSPRPRQQRTGRTWCSSSPTTSAARIVASWGEPRFVRPTSTGWPPPAPGSTPTTRSRSAARRGRP